MDDRHRTRRWRQRLALLVAMAGVTVVSGVVVATPAHADAGHCTPSSGLGDFHFVEDRWLRVFRITGGTPDIFVPTHTITNFNPAETYSAATFTVSSARTISTTNTLGFTGGVERMISTGLTVSASTMFSRATTESTTTTIGASIELQLPPQGRAEIDYGIYVIDLSFTMTVYYKDSCAFQGFAGPELARVPTIAQGFGDGRVWPSIYRGGIVNGVNYSANDIHPTTVVAIFGDYFEPTDTVLVTQNGFTQSISYGTEWFYDSFQQINASLASISLVPGTASVRVRAGNGRISNARTITIQP